MPQQARYLSTDPNAGLEESKYLSVDPNAGMAPAPTSSDRGSQLAGLGREFWGAVNPVETIKGLYGIVTDLGGTVKGIGQAHGRMAQEAEAAFRAGDYALGTRKFLSWMTPVVGPAVIDKSADFAAKGDYGSALGVILGFAGNMATPAAISKVGSVRVPFAPRNVNAAERAAVQFGLREGVPVDAATATGNRFVRGTQKLADESLLGSVTGAKARQAQADALAATGERLASRTAPAPVTAEQAGQGVRDAVVARGTALNAAAGRAYDTLRALEARSIGPSGAIRGPVTSMRPFTNIPLAVDIAPTKAALRPTYDALKREADLNIPLMGDKARILSSLDRMFQGPDLVPLSIADAVLSDVKSFARVDQAFQRTVGQGVAAKTVTSLDQAVVAAAKQGGADVFKALMDGRAATVNKYKAIGVFDVLRSEPVQVFNQLTARQDTAVNLLRQVQREAPKELPRLGRAYLEGLLEKATAEGGFGRAQGLMADWQKLGLQSKLLMFKNPTLIHDIDSFFLLAKRIADNPNPSGTALTVTKGGELSLLVSNPLVGVPVSVSAAGLSKLLHSPRAVRVMLRGLRVPVGNRAAATAATAEFGKIAREHGALLAPVAVTERQEPVRP